ncbi:MAG: DUF4920 domain-containing protein [Bacteroidota bacterium]
MRRLFLIPIASLFLLWSCAEQKAESEVENEVMEASVSPLSFYGEKIEEDGTLSTNELQAKFEAADTTNTMKITGTINQCCKKKGCWMTVDVGTEEELTVRFKDYGFFVPKDADGLETVMQGQLQREEISVEMRKHYAEDAGKTQEEIDAITEPEVKYTFMADGVIIKDYKATPEEKSAE